MINIIRVNACCANVTAQDGNIGHVGAFVTQGFRPGKAAIERDAALELESSSTTGRC